MFRMIPILILLAACGSTGPTRYSVVVPPVEERIAVPISSLEVREAELPLYAELEEIFVQTPEGGMISDTGVLWADDPRRSVTQGLAGALAQMTTARVAAEPWPLEELPEAQLEVRFDRLLARTDGVFEMSGHFFVAHEDGTDRAGRFELAVPYPPDGGAEAIADAKGVALAQLAGLIAREGLRGGGA